MTWVLLRLDDQVHDSRVPDVDHLMPRYTVTRESAPGNKIDFPRSRGVGDAHPTAGDRITEMPLVKVALMPDGRCEGTAEDSVMPILMHFLAHSHTVPSSGERVGKRWS
jgi:hypothetical protein